MSEKKQLGDSTRRAFVRTGGAAAGLAATGLAGTVGETLATDGGAPAVNYPKRKHSDLTRWPRYGAAEKKELHALIDRGDFYQQLPRFEKAFKDYVKAPYVQSHCNATSALTSAFFALDLPPGSEIMVPSYTFFATILPMRFFGYVPIFVDIDPKTVCFDLNDAAGKLTPRTKAMVPMHSWGMPCELDQIMDFAKKHGLVVLEDAAQAHGASMQGKAVGTWGEMGVWSFQASKPLPMIEGGMGAYRERKYYERAAAFGHYKAPPTFPANSPNRKYEGTGFGQKYRMHPFGAVVGLQQLEALDQRSALVEKQVRSLNDRLLALPGLSEPRVRPDQKRAYYFANMLFLDSVKAGFSRDQLLKALKAEGVRAHSWDYPEQHKFKIYSESKWWHHQPDVPERLVGCEQVNSSHIFTALLYEEAPDLINQYVKAFEKIWAHREKVASL
jgi:perosamine synthetase